MHHPMVDAISGSYTSAPELHITPTLIPKVTLDFVGRKLNETSRTPVFSARTVAILMRH